VRLGVRARAATAVALVAAFAATPTAWIESGPPLCVSRLLFDVECWGCGTTRALSSLLHGELGRALSFHRASPLVALLLLAAIVRWVRAGAREPRPDASRG
jgi:hypothetical protein